METVPTPLERAETMLAQPYNLVGSLGVSRELRLGDTERVPVQVLGVTVTVSPTVAAALASHFEPPVPQTLPRVVTDDEIVSLIHALKNKP